MKRDTSWCYAIPWSIHVPVRDEVFVEVFHGEGGDRSDVVKVDAAMKRSLMQQKDDVDRRSIFVFSFELKWRNQFGSA